MNNLTETSALLASAIIGKPITFSINVPLNYLFSCSGVDPG
jgi:hypothetical protein